MNKPPADSVDLAHQNAELSSRLEEAEELIHAIRSGAIDALAVQGPDGPRIFTLQGADQEYRTLIEEMSEGALLLSADATILYCNAGLATMLGTPLEEVIGSSFNDFIPAEFKAQWQALLANGWQGKGRGELPLLTRSGALAPFALSMNVLAFHELPALALIVTDLSAQREITVIKARVAAQNALIDQKNEEIKAQAAARLVVERAAAEARRLLESIPQIAWTASPDGLTTYLNHRWYDFTGQDPALSLGLQWQSHIHPDDLAPTAARWQHCLRTGEAYDVEYRFRNRAGDYRWLLGRALPSRNEHGDIIQWIGTCTDIHEHKLALERIDHAQHLLQDNNEQLRRANIDLDNFIYTASHDLKGPITNIEGLLDALLLELPAATRSAGDVQPLLGMMQGAIDRFKKTIEHLTEVAKLQKEHGLPVVPTALAPIIRDVVLDLAPLIKESDSQIKVDVDTCPTVPCTEKNLRSVVYNLLSNALKYRDPARPLTVHIGCQPAGDYALLTVQDNGLGLDLANDRKLFAMFERLHDHVEGSGIGLYMVKKIVENAGGHIEVQSQIGTGSTFRVFFKRQAG
jgi:PAS domain S-box-containing protein